jgi:integrase
MHVKGHLVVRANAMDQPFYEAKFRDITGRQVKRRLGAAWLERTDAGGWIQPPGRVPSGLLSRDDALIAMRDAIAVWQGEQAMAQAKAAATDEPTTFAEVASLWLIRAERRGRKLSTTTDYSYAIGVYLSATSTGSSRLGIGPAPFATLPLRELATNEGASVVAAWFDGMEPATSRTRSKLEMMTVSIFKYAIAQGWISVNPMDRVDRHHVSYDASKYDWYSSGEVRRLIQSAGNERDGLIYATMAYSGVRIGEALALEWGRIDFEARRISVTQNLSYGAIGTTKGGRGRTIPLVNQL